MDMLSQKDLKQIALRGITADKVCAQLEQFRAGFPFLRLESAASVGHGIMRIEAHERSVFIKSWQDFRENSGKKVLKFVPASGAASRMFKDLYAFLSASYDVPTTSFEQHFFKNIGNFAFYNALNEQCLKVNGKDIDEMLSLNRYKEVVSLLLDSKGLGYGSLPKGLLLFHKYGEDARTPVEEHLVEGALYASCKGKVCIHFTVSCEHLSLFKSLIAQKVEKYSTLYGVTYDITFSEQKPSTDTIAANPDNTPFRTKKGELFFRPGGHGALIENLNDIDADIIFIKNIDNITPDRLKEDTVEYKQVLAGALVTLQKKAFDYLNLLDSGRYTHSDIEEIIRFVQQDLCCRKADIKHLEDAELVIYLRKKLNRPMRVCGVVKNSGEPGGGPFLAYNADGTISPQILESSQIDKNNNEYVKMLETGTHFNPVDLVCGTKDYLGKPFNLPDYVDISTGFISSKSKDGQELKALELPGLWNGAMSDWNTVFIEVPLSTFTPVKTVNDLLREEHN